MKHFEEFKEIVSVIVRGKEITPETELKSLGIDSLDLVGIISDAEEKYNIEFTNEELQSFVTVGDVVKSIDSKLN